MNDVVVARKLVVDHFRQSAEGKWPASKIEEVVASLDKLTTRGYTAAGFFGGFLFYARVVVQFNAGHGPFAFEGDAGGLFSVGISSLNGQLYTNDVDKLVMNTRHFHFSVVPAYSSVEFFDNAGELLGYSSAVSVGSFSGTGSGDGQWKR
ncbi:VapA/VapB family virulence-associated protein [Pendulispora albinea]|uniref:VapA/VapB family virulence-associated protein n=1 Tax=Pendulispora albinea TaxID=2741071 RepID=A0ABZ2LZ96_9BACT